MDTTLNSNCNQVLSGAWQDNSRQTGALEFLGRLVEQYLYPEIRSDDNRIAEYIPPKVGPGRG